MFVMYLSSFIMLEIYQITIYTVLMISGRKRIDIFRSNFIKIILKINTIVNMTILRFLGFKLMNIFLGNITWNIKNLNKNGECNKYTVV